MPTKKRPVRKPVKSGTKKPLPQTTRRGTAAPKTASARMTLAEVMRVLEKAGSAKTRQTYARHGANGPMFGVQFGELFKLWKRIGVDHALARELWSTGNVDARNLAMKLADPHAMTPSDLDAWAIGNTMPMCGLYIATLAAEGPHGVAKLREWLASADVRLRAMGWTLLARLSDLDVGFSDADLQARLGRIEKSIHAASNEERAQMNKALISIGGRSPALRKEAIAAAKRIGEVVVDHGDTACKTPDAAAAIEKMWERATARKLPSPAAHERSLGSMRTRC